MNHYDWLDANLDKFTQALGFKESLVGLIVAHGDKCYGYKDRFKKAGIPFHHGVAIYLLTYVLPYSKKVRQTTVGWVDPIEWIVDSYQEFKPFLPE